MSNLRANGEDIKFCSIFRKWSAPRGPIQETLPSAFPFRMWYCGSIAGGLDKAVCSTIGKPIAAQQRHFLDLLPQHLDSIILLTFHLLKLRLLSLGSVVFRNAIHNEPVRNAHDEDYPEEFENLERSQQPESDDIGEQAFILLCLPVEFVGANFLELGGEGKDNAQIQIVTLINPHTHKDEEVQSRQEAVDIVDFRYLRKSLGSVPFQTVTAAKRNTRT